MSSTDADKAAFWKNLLRAVDTEPQSAGFVRGISGLEHPVIAVGVDNTRRRLVIVSGEHDARSAAIAQLDIQRAIESTQVIVARPIAVNLGVLAKQITGFLGGSTVPALQLPERLKALPDQDEMQKLLAENFPRYVSGFDVATINWVAQIMQLVQQLAMIEVEIIEKDGPPSSSVFHLEKLENLDPAELDRHLGICPIPLYEMTPEDAQTVQRGADIDAVRDVLRRRDILQFFFSASDQLALGLVDRDLRQPSAVLDELSKAPSFGHPFGPPELTSPSLPIAETIEALEEKGYLVDGEIGLELTKGAQSVRASIRFKPREGIVSKIANNISIKLDLKDLFRPSGT